MCTHHEETRAAGFRASDFRLRLEPVSRFAVMAGAWSLEPDGNTLMSSHIVPLRTYYLIFLTLMVCTAITVAVAFVDLGPMNIVVAMTIAVLKATLVVLFFMHVKYSTRLTWVVVLGSIFWLGILIVMTAGDYLTRGWRTYG